MSSEVKASPQNLSSHASALESFPEEINTWRKHLEGIDIVVSHIAYEHLEPWGSKAFYDADQQYQERINVLLQDLKQRLSPQQPVALNREKNNLIVAYLMSLHGEQKSIFACQILPLYNEKTLKTVQLSLGLLHSAIYAHVATKNARAGFLLELMGYVLSQKNAHMAAQEWINRTMSWVRANKGSDLGLSLSLFNINKAVPKWWVSSDMAWAEKGAATMQFALEVAMRAVIEGQEQTDLGLWALPVFEQGEVQAVLVAYQPANKAKEIPIDTLDILRSSTMMSEPILRHWIKSEQHLISHIRESIIYAWSSLTGHGHYTWKVISLAVVLVFMLITFWPVHSLVNANLNVEGKTRWVITAPTQGFLTTVKVRPGDKVVEGQVLATLDDRDLRIEQAQYQSETQQAADRFRTAMADNDATASGIAANDLSQNEAKLAAVNSNLARLVLKAPITGIITNGDWIQQIGAPIENGKQLFEIANQDAYRVVLQVLDQDIDRVHVGQRGILRLTSSPSQTYSFQVDRVTPVASVQSGKNSFRVEGIWIDSPPALNPGMQGVGKIIVGKTNLIGRWTHNFMNWARLKFWGFW